MNEAEERAERFRTVLLLEVSEEQVLEAMMAGIHRHHGAATKPVAWKSLLEGTFRELRIGSDKNVESYEHHNTMIAEHPDYLKLQAAALRMVALGYAIPLGDSTQYKHIRILQVVLTDRGRQACRPVADAPSNAGYLHRLMQAHPMAARSEADEVFLRLQDAASCLEFNLYRPAVVMIGIAAEVTTFQAYAAMKALALVSGKHEEFAARLDALRKAHEQQPDSDERRRILMALDMIESARVMRNNAAHSGNPNPDPFLARERFGAACFHLPVVWEIVIVPNLP